MWDFLAKLPTTFSFTIIILCLIAIVIISLRGKISARIGKNLIDLGRGPSEDKKPKDSIIPPPPNTSMITLPTPKRRCGNCILIMFGEREKFEVERQKTLDSILKTQMNFVEQKLIEIQTILIDDFSSELSRHKDNDCMDAAVYHKLFYGLLKDMLLLLKDEIRRSFKENNFFDLDDREFSDYMRNKTRALTSTLIQHTRNIYPSSSVIDINTVVKIIDIKSREIEDAILDMYNQAKFIKKEAKGHLEVLKQKFCKWIDDFIA